MKGYRMVSSIFLLFLFCCFLGESKTSKIASKQPLRKTTTLHEEADRLDYDDAAKVIRLYGHVKLFEGETSLFADNVIYDFKSREVKADGKIKFFRKQDTLLAEHLHIYYRENRAVAEGNPVRYVSENVSSQKLPLAVMARQLDYRWREKVIRGNGNIDLEQKGLRALADQMFYDGEKEEVILDGHVHLLRSFKDSLWCDHLVYSLQTNQSQASGNVRAEFVFTEKP